ncbi:wings apart-like protein homolog [Patella vulgata]|uniref:wings apart-like protein homolog n=1 Tax=Patella vulgata TaxID=6465 RepID=UPI0021805CB3|nr:wings apart-like protein homolog [Patella vulgata]
MSSSTLRRTGGRTYGRGKESPASRAFDELISNKPAPIKAASTSTKWGKTNFIAVRESPRKKMQAASASSSASSSPRKAVAPKVDLSSEDVFCFESEGDSPRKGKSSVARGPTSKNTKLPATRIAVTTQPEDDPYTSSSPAASVILKSQEDESDVQVAFSTENIRRSTKTYSKTTAVINRNPYTRTPSIIKSSDSITLVSLTTPPTLESESQPSSEAPSEALSEHDAFGFSQLDAPPTLSPYDASEEEVKQEVPIRTYGKAKKVDKTMAGWSNYEVPKKVRNSKYNNPKLLENFKRMWDSNQKNKPNADVGGFAHSNVVSKSQFKSGDKTTMVVVCKPKVVSKAEGDVQTKYFGQPGREFPRGYKPNVVVGVTDSSTSQEDSSPLKYGDSAETSSKSDFPQTSPSVQSTSQSSSQASADPPAVDNDEIFDISTKSKPIPASSLKPVVPSRGNRIFRSRGAKNDNSYQEEEAPNEEDTSSAPVSQEDEPMPSAVKPVKSGYRIFKSRAPKQTEVKVEQTMEYVYIMSEDDVLMVDSVAVNNPDEPPVLIRSDTLPIQDSSDIDNNSVDSRNNSQKLNNVDESDVDSQGNASEDSRENVNLESVDSPSSDVQPLTKTRKIFKTRNSKKNTNQPTQSPSKAIYNARSWQNEDLSPEAQGTIVLVKTNKQKRKAVDNDVVDDVPTLKMKRNVHWPTQEGEEAYTSLKVNKEHKQLFTVVRNVKESFEMQESGETQEFTDDVEYLLDSLKNTEPISIRCISCIQLAQKCKLPAFRMHLRAHGTVTKIFTMLHDACIDPSLSLCTATIMFMLSQDRLNMDLDTESLNLMLRLLEVDSDKEREKQYDSNTRKELEKNKLKIKELCEQLQKAGLAKTLDLDSLTTGNLAMESLLSLTSRKAGEWFKEELRSQGALDHVVDTIASCSKCAEDVLQRDIVKTLPVLKKLDRCLRVLENITFMNTDNQSYLIDYKSAILVTSLCCALKGCVECLPYHPVMEDPEENKEVKESIGWVVFNCMLAVLRVLLNVTHDNDIGSAKVGEQDAVINVVLECILSTPQYIPQEQKFDLLVLSLGLLINLVEHSEMNRQILIESEVSTVIDGATYIKTGINCLVELFCEREEAARMMEDKEEEEEGESKEETKDEASAHNKSGEWQETEAGVQWIVKSAESIKAANQAKLNEDGNTSTAPEPTPLDDDETFTKALHKAGKHMENSIVASYIALLLGCLIRDNKDYVCSVKCYLPDESFDPMIKTLKKFLGFMNLTIAIGNTGGKSIARVIEVLESC